MNKSLIKILNVKTRQTIYSHFSSLQVILEELKDNNENLYGRLKDNIIIVENKMLLPTSDMSNILILRDIFKVLDGRYEIYNTKNFERMPEHKYMINVIDFGDF